MKNAILGTIAIASVAAATPVAAQGIPVHDNAALLQHIEQIQRTMEMIDQGREQIAEAQRLYNDLNGLTDISSIADQLTNDALRELNVDIDSLEAMTRGDFGASPNSGRANEAYQMLMDQLSGDESAEYRAAYDRDARAIAMNTALAESLGEAATSRAEGLQELRQRLATAESAKEVADLTARIELEIAGMRNDELRLQAIDRRLAAERRARDAELSAQAVEQSIYARDAYRARIDD